jgi:hypothetical protein
MDNTQEKILEKLDTWERSPGFMILVSYPSIYEGGKDTSIYTMRLEPPIMLDSPDYEIGLLDLETYYSFPNIDSSNNNLRYWSKAKSAYVVITLATGAYNISELYAELKAKFLANGDVNKPVKITALQSSAKAEMTLTNTIVDFTYPNSINKILGFDNKQYGDISLPDLTYISESIVNIIDISSIYVNSDIVANSYENGKSSNVLYSFFPTVPPNYKIVEKPNPPSYLPIKRSYIDSISFWLNDDKGRRLNMRGENVTMRFYLKKIPLK